MEPNDINSIQPEINPSLNISKIKKAIPLNLIIGIAIGVLLTASTVSAFYFYQSSKKNSNLSDLPIPSVYPTDVPATPTPETSPYQITWLEKPQKIASLDIFDQSKFINDEGILFDQSRFYLIANLGDGSQLINLFLPTEGMTVYENIYRLIKSKDGSISILNSDTFSQLEKYLLPKVKTSNLSFRELDPPESIMINNFYFTKNYTNNKTFDTLTDPKLIKSTEYGDLYVVYSARKDIEGLYDKNYYLKLKDWTLYIYKQKYNFISDNRNVWFKWNDNSDNGDQFFDIVSSGGCGGSGGSTIIKNDSSLLNNKVLVATDNSTNFYQIKDASNPFLIKIYDLYKTTSQYITPAPIPNINDYANAKTHFLYQDFSGDWVVFINQKYTVVAECGKPVIYLYPEKETQIKVQVSAKISQSEPTYPEKGWIVNAKPNGELTYQNKNYPYLFWEGLGNGFYPDYKNRGTLVNQKDLVTTVYKQLSQLGLNQKESADFMEFWQSKLPKTPYVRLTWLGTQDMDILAPLSVYPQPDTKIRVFLEFEGFEKPVSLIPQKLSSPKRQGFTLIEWGGLLLK